MLNNVRWRISLHQGACFFRRHFAITKHVYVIYRTSADGMASAVILTDAITRLGGTVTSIALEKLYPALLEKIHSDQKGLVIYVDLASNCASSIMKINQGRANVLILDHHLPDNARCPYLYHFNPYLSKIRGDKQVAASGLAYLLVNELGIVNKDLSFLSIIGAIADHQDRGGLIGLNYELYKKLEKAGQIIPRNIECPSDSLIKTACWSSQSHTVTLADFVSDLTTLCVVGYTSGGVALAKNLCTDGYNDSLLSKLHELQNQKIEQYQELRDWISQGGLQQSTFLQWFDLDNRFASMSLKMIGEFITQVQNETIFEPYKYIIAFRHVPTEFPDIGSVNLSRTEALIRLPPALEQRMFVKKELSLLDFVPRATHDVGGAVDGCHSYAAAITIPNGMETKLIDHMNEGLNRSRLQSRSTA